MPCCGDDDDLMPVEVLEKAKELGYLGIEAGCCEGSRRNQNPTERAWDIHEQKIKWNGGVDIPILVQLVHPQAKMPEKKRHSDLGYDIFCVPDESWRNGHYELMPYESHLFSTGIKVATPNQYGFILRDRSSMGIKDVTVEAGVIEGTYRGEWKVQLINLGKTPCIINAGDKIVQAILIPILPSMICPAESLPSTDRGEKGFGSSGR